MNIQIISTGKIDASVTLPGSKYIANRLLPMCALARSESKLTNVVENHDIVTSTNGLRQLGYLFSRESNCLIVKPRVRLPENAVEIFTAHSGTFSRFITAVAALESVPVAITCSDKMATRPMLELFDALKSLSVKIDSPNDCLPAIIHGPIKQNHCALDSSRSSQYLSALLIIAPLLEAGLEVQLIGEQVSRAYVDMTIRLMAKMGVKVEELENGFRVKSGQVYHGIEYAIPGDTVSATYFMGAAAISGGRVTITSFDFDSVQGEAKFYQVLEKMGVNVTRSGDDLVIQGSRELNAIEVDMGEMPDAVQTLAAVACFANGATKITNIAHLAYKESNRIEDTANEIRKTGIQVESGEDYLVIHGGHPKAAEFSTHEDHRMAMSLALIGIKTEGIKIKDANVVEKSFPTYWDFLEAIGIKCEQY
ncbi:3-phosphoshikimate 1-carboxyvinyltransferase [Aliikangiella sp. IMCC44359]|uniref:3-phosphoshikimate 1-carboxyvinyltransferase n=1 Tax=Aliikangiella sp. IMCC44359 TaxID=3459125 RepID=UPI00403B1A2C